jgi:hypothetical protein
VGLVQSVIEKAGIPTVSISLLREVTEYVKPPRALLVDRPLGFPLGTPHDIDLQKRIVMSALELLRHVAQKPFLSDFIPTSGPISAFAPALSLPRSAAERGSSLLDESSESCRSYQ